MKGVRLSYLACALMGTLVASSVLPAAAQSETRQSRDPSFSPDGRQVVYLRDVRKAGEVRYSSQEIWIAETEGTTVDTTHARRLTVGFKDEQPRFSPDGRQIVFMRDYDLWLADIAGTANNTTTVTPARNLTNSKAYESHAEFTNNGKRLLFNRQGSLVLREIESGAERVLLETAYEVKQAINHPSNDNQIFAICKKFGADGKPVKGPSQGETVVEIHLDSPRTSIWYSAAANTTASSPKASLSNLRPTSTGVVFNYSDYPNPSKVIQLINGADHVVPDIGLFTDLSRDGSKFASIGLVKDKAEPWGIVIRPATLSSNN